MKRDPGPACRSRQLIERSVHPRSADADRTSPPAIWLRVVIRRRCGQCFRHGRRAAELPHLVRPAGRLDLPVRGPSDRPSTAGQHVIAAVRANAELAMLRSFVESCSHRLRNRIRPRLIAPVPHSCRCSKLTSELVGVASDRPVLRDRPVLHHSGEFDPHSIRSVRRQRHAACTVRGFAELVRQWTDPHARSCPQGRCSHQGFSTRATSIGRSIGDNVRPCAGEQTRLRRYSSCFESPRAKMLAT